LLRAPQLKRFIRGDKVKATLIQVDPSRAFYHDEGRDLLIPLEHLAVGNSQGLRGKAALSHTASMARRYINLAREHDGLQIGVLTGPEAVDASGNAIKVIFHHMLSQVDQNDMKARDLVEHWNNVIRSMKNLSDGNKFNQRLNRILGKTHLDTLEDFPLLVNLPGKFRKTLVQKGLGGGQNITISLEKLRNGIISPEFHRMPSGTAAHAYFVDSEGNPIFNLEGSHYQSFTPGKILGKTAAVHMRDLAPGEFKRAYARLMLKGLRKEEISEGDVYGSLIWNKHYKFGARPLYDIEVPRLLNLLKHP